MKDHLVFWTYRLLLHLFDSSVLRCMCNLYQLAIAAITNENNW